MQATDLDPSNLSLILPEVADESIWRQGKLHYSEPQGKIRSHDFRRLGTGGSAVGFYYYHAASARAGGGGE